MSKSPKNPEEEGARCTTCGAYPGFVNQSKDEKVFFALECDCPKRTSFMRNQIDVAEEWKTSTFKLSEEDAKKVEGLCPSDKNFKT